jgi:PhnB protein
MAVSRFSKNIAGAGARVADMSVNPIPEGYTSLTPFLVIDGAAGAIEFYTSVFGATLIEKMDGSNGLISHAELDFADGRLQLSDPNPDYKLEAPERKESVTHSMVLYCPDVDDVVARAEKAGATIREAAQTFVTGDRFASIIDPFGQRWAVMTRVEQVDAEERDRRLAEWAKDNA